MIVCGERLTLDEPTMTWLRSIRTSVPTWTGDIIGELRCVLEAHPDSPIHWDIGRYMPEPCGDIWARWHHGYSQPMHLGEWSGCLAKVAGGELCGGPAAHNGGHGYQLAGRERSARLAHPYRHGHLITLPQETSPMTAGPDELRCGP